MIKKILFSGLLLLITNNIGSYRDIDLNLENRILEENKIEIIGEEQKSFEINFYDFFRYVYSDAFSNIDPFSNNKLNKKNIEEIKKGINLRNELENKYLTYLKSNLDYDLMFDNSWGPIIKNEYNIPKGTYRKNHEALDIFSKHGTYIFSPFNGLVIASGDNWEGKSEKGKIVNWNNKGLTIRGGNGVIIYNPIENGYLLISHLQENLNVNAGDIILKGDTIGRLGNTGTAIRKGHGGHIHVAYKLVDEKSNALRGINFEYKLSK